MYQKHCFFLLVLVGVAFSLYNCNPQTCRLPNCQCATVSNPGGFAPADSPQFVVLSFDDSVNSVSLQTVQPLLDQLSNVKDTAGCSPKTVFFFLTAQSDYYSLTLLRATKPIEVATHTITHSTGNSTTLATWQKEIAGCRNFTEKLSMVPLSENVGFRYPNLAYNNEGFQVLLQHKYLYDSSLIEYWGSGLSQKGQMYFPFTLDNGSPLNNDGGPALNSFPGLWEIPMHDLHSNGIAYAAMDPAGTSDFVLQLLKDNFMDHYNGNRSPFGIYLHATWLAADPTRIKVLVDFYNFVANMTGVMFVTNKQIIDWSRNPTNLQTTIDRFKCSSQLVVPPSPEICNGIDDNQNGQIDEGTTNNCVYLGQQPFTTCGLCPNSYPSLALDFTTNPTCGNKVCNKGIGNNAGKTCVNCPQDCGVCFVTNSTSTTGTLTGTQAGTKPGQVGSGAINMMSWTIAVLMMILSVYF